ncbi:MAG: hypothetical protein ACAH35_02345 [Candidatus Paceibacterota bacterium]
MITFSRKIGGSEQEFTIDLFPPSNSGEEGETELLRRLVDLRDLTWIPKGQAVECYMVHCWTPEVNAYLLREDLRDDVVAYIEVQAQLHAYTPNIQRLLFFKGDRCYLVKTDETLAMFTAEDQLPVSWQQGLMEVEAIVLLLLNGLMIQPKSAYGVIPKLISSEVRDYVQAS